MPTYEAITCVFEEVGTQWLYLGQDKIEKGLAIVSFVIDIKRTMRTYHTRLRVGLFFRPMPEAYLKKKYSIRRTDRILLADIHVSYNFLAVYC